MVEAHYVSVDQSLIFLCFFPAVAGRNATLGNTRGVSSVRAVTGVTPSIVKGLSSPAASRCK